MSTSYRILSSTLFTLFISFWCCICPGFPSPHDSKLRTLSTKLNIIFWLLIFPEGVLFWSTRQWYEAGNVPKEVIQNRGWTRRHGFFLLMGGFIFCDKEGRPVKILSAYHFKILVLKEVIGFPTLTSFEIQEQNNLHSAFAFLAFLQGTWFLCQCLPRLPKSNLTSPGLPVITQWEAITATLVIASWCLFLFSYEKPLDPRSPILIRLKVKRPILLDHDQIMYREISDFEREQRQSQKMTKRRFQFERPQPESTSRLKPIPRLIFYVAIWPFQSIINDIIRFLPSSQIIQFSDGTLKVPLFYVDNRIYFWPKLLPPAAMLSMVTSFLSFLFILRLDSASVYFSSPTVYRIWRITSIMTTSISAVTLFLVVLIQLFDYLGDISAPGSVWKNRLFDVKFGFFAILLLVGAISLAPFLIARIILLISSFVCLKSTPGDAFVGQWSWTEYIPHLQ